MQDEWLTRALECSSFEALPGCHYWMMLVSIEPTVLLFGGPITPGVLGTCKLQHSLSEHGSLVIAWCEHGASQLTCPTVCFSSKRNHLPCGWKMDSALT